MVICGGSLRLPWSRGVLSSKSLVAAATVSWRLLAATRAVYSYVDRKTGMPVRRSQSYGSSPMEQIMERVVAREDASHDTESIIARPEKLMLTLELRTCK
eukprot:6183196-Pleurochrysis_carterae.AAC.3